MKFVHDVPASRVVFGAGRLDAVAAEVEHMKATRALIVASIHDQETIDRIIADIGDVYAGTFSDARMHVPIEVANAAVAAAQEASADLIIAFGGGSAIGVAKAIAKETSIPILAIPTTYAGSEMTSIWGLTSDGRKVTGRDPRVLPKSVIYDPILTLPLPADVSAASGMNALAHLVESMYAPQVSPLALVQSAEGVRALAVSLPRVVHDPADLSARSEAQYGAWLGGWSLGTSGMGVHHKIAHVLGGTFDLPHAQTHSALLAYACEYNESSAPEAMRRLRAALAAGGVDAPSAAQGIWNLATTIGAPTSLAEVGFTAAGVDEAAELVVAGAPVNPAPVTVEGIRDLLNRALVGARPA